MARDLNVGRYTPMILTGSFAILLGALLLGLTDISTGGVIIIAVVHPGDRSRRSVDA